MKTDQELRDRLDGLLALDATEPHFGLDPMRLTFSKVAACKALLWALGENDDDHWHITAKPGPPVDVRVKARN